MTKKSTFTFKSAGSDKIEETGRTKKRLKAGRKGVSISNLACRTYLMLLCLLLITCAPVVSAQNVNFEWAKNIGGAGRDVGEKVAVDGNGNVYVTGNFAAEGADCNRGGSGGGLSSAGGNDVFVAKYHPSGTFLWAKSMGGKGIDAGNGLAVDGNGNVYVTGSLAAEGADFNPGGSGGVVASAGGTDVFVAKYNANGTFLWAKSMGGTDGDWGQDITVDGKGNLYIIGRFLSATADFNPGGNGGAITTAGGNVFVAKYDPSGNFLWVKSIGSAGRNDQAYGVAADGTGNVYVTGQFSATGNFNPDGGGGTLTAAGGNDAFVAKYDPSGAFLWAKSMGGTGADVGQGLALDGKGNVYVSGRFPAVGADVNPGGSGGALTSAGSIDVFIAKYDLNGAFVWAKSLGGAGGDLPWGIAAAADGTLYITGEFGVQGADFNPGGIGGALTAAGGNDVFVASYDSSGGFLWAKSMGGTGSDVGNGVAVDGTGNVYVTGQFPAAGADFNPGGTGGSLVSAGGNDGFVVRLSQGCTFFTTFIESACDSFVFRGVTYTTSGTYVDTFVSSANCDSIVTLDLVITGHSTHTVHIGHYCDSVTFNAQTYTSSGTYVQAYTSMGGCDSNFTYELTIGKSNSDTLTQTACDRFVFNDTTVYTTTGVHTLILTNESGCDSTVVLHLTIKRSPEASVVKTGSILTANSADRYQWMNCDDHTIIPGAIGQSYTATKNGNYAAIISLNDCSDTSDCVFVDNITGINEWKESDIISIYPNPVHSKVTIQTEKALQHATIRLISIVGQSVAEQTDVSGTTFTVDVAPYANGVYFVEINEGGSVIRMKIVKY